MISPLKPANTRTQRARRRATILVIVVVGLASMLAACGPVQHAQGVSLLPNPTVKNESWRWTPTCPLGPSTRGACGASGPNFGAAQLDGDLWNLGSGAGSGSVNMGVDSHGALTVRGDLASAPPCTRSTCIASSANTWVRGYPSVLYGINQCSARSSPPVSPSLQLPMNVGAIPDDLIGTTSYSSQTPHVTHDVAYDMWLNSSATRTCKTDGTLEVMVWTDYNDQALLPQSVPVGTASVPFKVNDVVRPGTGAWSVFVSNVFGAGHTVPWGGTVYFILNKADVVNMGTVSVDLSTVLSEVGTLLQNDYGWHDFAQRYWLDTVPFGIEFGPESAAPYGAGSAYFSWQLSSYCLGVGTTLADAACDRLASR